MDHRTLPPLEGDWYRDAYAPKPIWEYPLEQTAEAPSSSKSKGAAAIEDHPKEARRLNTATADPPAFYSHSYPLTPLRPNLPGPDDPPLYYIQQQVPFGGWNRDPAPPASDPNCSINHDIRQEPYHGSQPCATCGRFGVRLVCTRCDKVRCVHCKEKNNPKAAQKIFREYKLKKFAGGRESEM